MQFNSPAGYGANIGLIDRATFDAGLRAHMVRVYNIMVLGLLMTAITAFAVVKVPAIQSLFYTVEAGKLVGISALGWIAIFSPLAINFFGMRLNHSSNTLGTVFFVYAALIGISLATLAFAYTGVSMARVFFITAGTFAATSLYGYTTKRDLTKISSFLLMGLIGLIIASVVNIFLGWDTLSMVISALVVVVSVGLIAFSTQSIKESYAAGHGHEGNTRLALIGAYVLYTNFINLFTSLMHLLGNRE